MNIKNIINSYLGNKQVNRIYQGPKLVWSKYFDNKYLISGAFNSYSPNVNLYEIYKNTISIYSTFDGTTYEFSPFNGLTNNIVVTLDNSTQIDPEFSVTKVNRLNSNVNQADYIRFGDYEIEPGKIAEFSFWYYGTYGTVINLYSQYDEVYVERWDASTNDYITNNSRYCAIPVTTNTWQYIQVRARNTHTTLNRRGIRWLILHDNQRVATLSNTEYWKITCVKSWHVESITKNKILRLNDDDTVDNTWYNNTNYISGTFYSNLVYDNINSKIYVGGDQTIDGGLVRFNLDGTKDTSFDIGTGFNARVRAVTIDNTNSKIYVGGQFTTYNGGTQNRLIRLNMDGTKDLSFDIGTGFNSHIWNIILVNSKLYVCGQFTTYQGSRQWRLIRLNLDGSKDSSFDIGTGFDGIVNVINIDTINSKIYVGGNFTTYKGITQNYLVKLNLDGSVDTSFDIGTGFDGVIYAINIDTINSKIYVGGYFNTYQGNPQNCLVRLNMDGSVDTSFDIGTGFNGWVGLNSGILVDNEKNKIYITGAFTTYNDISANGIARLNMNGSLDNTFNIQLTTATATAILKYTE